MIAWPSQTELEFWFAWFLIWFAVAIAVVGTLGWAAWSAYQAKDLSLLWIFRSGS
jgi:hypothetical protein